MTEQASPLDLFLDVNEASFRQATERGLPVFLTHARQSTPVTATPYLVRYGVFQAAAAGWSGREALALNLDAVLREARGAGVRIEAMLVGGSFTELQKGAIDDIDCLIFYSLTDDLAAQAVERLGEIQNTARSSRVDARFVPLDSDPLMLLKLVSYFTILYSKHKDHNEIVRSLILVDCREPVLPICGQSSPEPIG